MTLRYFIVSVSAALFAFPALSEDMPKAKAQGITPQTDCVILLHGLARTRRSMIKMERHLSAQGYHVVNTGYASRQHAIGDLAKPTIDAALEGCPRSARINFVTHSLGGILLRQYIAKETIENFHRAVMLGPPNQGSQVPDALGGWPGFEALNGPAGMELGTDAGSVPAQLPAADFDVGIIAGKRTINLILSGIIPEADDGKVSIENTKLEGMRDHITLPISHPFLMKNKKALRQVDYYLVHGQFERVADAAHVSAPTP